MNRLLDNLIQSGRESVRNFDPNYSCKSDLAQKIAVLIEQAYRFGKTDYLEHPPFTVSARIGEETARCQEPQEGGVTDDGLAGR